MVEGKLNHRVLAERVVLLPTVLDDDLCKFMRGMVGNENNPWVVVVERVGSMFIFFMCYFEEDGIMPIKMRCISVNLLAIKKLINEEAATQRVSLPFWCFRVSMSTVYPLSQIFLLAYITEAQRDQHSINRKMSASPTTEARKGQKYLLKKKESFRKKRKTFQTTFLRH